MPKPESFNDALVECVKAAGGSKVVGLAIWPAKGLEAAQRHLLACLSEAKPERLGPEQVLFVLRLARDRGCHIGVEFILDALSYAPPQPVEPKDAADVLRRQILDMGRTLQVALARLDAVEKPTLRGVG